MEDLATQPVMTGRAAERKTFVRAGLWEEQCTCSALYITT